MTVTEVDNKLVLTAHWVNHIPPAGSTITYERMDASADPNILSNWSQSWQGGCDGSANTVGQDAYNTTAPVNSYPYGITYLWRARWDSP